MCLLLQENVGPFGCFLAQKQVNSKRKREVTRLKAPPMHILLPQVPYVYHGEEPLGTPGEMPTLSVFTSREAQATKAMQSNSVTSGWEYNIPM